MLLAVDVFYTGARAIAGGVAFRHWTDASAVEEVVHVGRAPNAYRPGEFYRRELPSILAVVQECSTPTSTLIVVDGYVWLAHSQKGLGAHVHDALSG